MPNAFTGSIKTVHAGFSIKILAPSRGPEVLNCRAARTTPDSKLFLAWLANVIDILDYNFTILGDNLPVTYGKKMVRGLSQLLNGRATPAAVASLLMAAATLWILAKTLMMEMEPTTGLAYHTQER